MTKLYSHLLETFGHHAVRLTKFPAGLWELVARRASHFLELLRGGVDRLAKYADRLELAKRAEYWASAPRAPRCNPSRYWDQS